MKVKFLFKIVAALIPSSRARKNFRLRHGLKRVAPPICKIGKFSYVSHGCQAATAHSQIGSYCSIGVNVMVGTSRHPTNWLSTSPVQYQRGFLGFPVNDEVKAPSFESVQPVVIGNDVWIGMNAIIMDGVKGGDGAIVGAGAVVTKDVPPYAVVAGVPAHVIRYRFDEQTVKELVALKWWELDVAEVAGLPFENVEECIAAIKRLGRKKCCA